MSDNEFTFNLVPQATGANFHTRNAPGEDFRMTFAQSANSALALQTKIKLVEVHHGYMTHENKRCEATLLLLRIIFQSQRQDRRYKSARVKFEFFDKGENELMDPEVVKLTPDGTHWLNKTTRDKTTRYGTSVTGRDGIDIAGIETGVQWGVESIKPQKFKATVVGISTFSDRRNEGKENTVQWTMEENKDEEEGVPSCLQAAVLLKRAEPRPFYAKVHISSEVDAVSRFNRSSFSPYTTDEDKDIDHVTFTPGSKQLDSSEFTQIKQRDLENMERLPMKQYCRVSLSEEDILLAPDLPTSVPLHTATEEMDRVAMAPLVTGQSPLVLAGDAVAKAAEAAAKAAEAAAKASEAAAQAAHAVIKAAEAAVVLASAS